MVRSIFFPFIACACLVPFGFLPVVGLVFTGKVCCCGDRRRYRSAELSCLLLRHLSRVSLVRSSIGSVRSSIGSVRTSICSARLSVGSVRSPRGLPFFFRLGGRMPLLLLLLLGQAHIPLNSFHASPCLAVSLHVVLLSGVPSCPAPMPSCLLGPPPDIRRWTAYWRRCCFL